VGSVPPAGVEPVNGLDQADAARLHQVVHRFAAIGVAAGQEADQRQVHRDEPLAYPVALPAVPETVGELDEHHLRPEALLRRGARIDGRG